MSDLLILPHQLFYDISFESISKAYVVEHPHFFTKRRFHKQKLIFHRASMKAYVDFLEKKKVHVTYVDFEKAEHFLKNLKNKELIAFDPIEHPLQKELVFLGKKQTSFTYLPSPMFITSESVLEAFKKGKDSHYSMQKFYIMQRKSLDLLMDGDKPKGDKWSFDTENRKPMPKTLQPPKITFPKLEAHGKEAIDYIEKHFKDNFGESSLLFPIEIKAAHSWLQEFLKERLEDFGAYEDAIVPHEHFLFHSGLSPLLNCGILTPKQVVEATMEYAKHCKVSLSSLEGFIRQIIGWREYMRILYDIRGEALEKENYFSHHKKLPQAFWLACTGIDPIDTTIKKIELTAYAHHIERLMVLGNFMLLCNFHPRAIYEWFMEMFIDSYEWVMVTNVMAMSQYADGGKMTTKPYISSSNYILKMSHYTKDSWCEIWDALYWVFMEKHSHSFEKNPRMTMMLAVFKKIPEEKKRRYQSIVDAFFKTLEGV